LTLILGPLVAAADKETSFKSALRKWLVLLRGSINVVYCCPEISENVNSWVTSPIKRVEICRPVEDKYFPNNFFRVLHTSLFSGPVAGFCAHGNESSVSM
jgi:hypothetical protein